MAPTGWYDNRWDLTPQTLDAYARYSNVGNSITRYGRWDNTVNSFSGGVLIPLRKKTKKELQKMRARLLHKKSFVRMHEVKPNVFKVVGMSFKGGQPHYHKNFGLNI